MGVIIVFDAVRMDIITSHICKIIRINPDRKLYKKYVEVCTIAVHAITIYAEIPS